MNRSTRSSLSVVLASAVISLSPWAAAAQPAPATAMTADQVRDEYLSRGYQVGAPITWWTNNHVTTFTVFDRSEQVNPTGRVLMVLVYPDAATAQVENLNAQALETGGNPGLLTTAPGPHLVPGYGPSILRQNVALVKSTQSELARLYAAQLDCDTFAASGTGAAPQLTPAPAAYAVDIDFVSALDKSIGNL